MAKRKIDFRKWNPETFDWGNRSAILAEDYSKDFHKLWEPSKFNWKKDSASLCEYCTDYISEWWNPR